MSEAQGTAGLTGIVSELVAELLAGKRTTLEGKATFSEMEGGTNSFQGGS